MKFCKETASGCTAVLFFCAAILCGCASSPDYAVLTGAEDHRAEAAFLASLFDEGGSLESPELRFLLDEAELAGKASRRAFFIDLFSSWELFTALSRMDIERFTLLGKFANNKKNPLY